LDCFGNKTRASRVSCLAAQLGANWCRSGPDGEISHGKKDLDDHGQGLGRREVLECMVWAGTGAGASTFTVVQGNKPLAIVDKTLAG
jgi:hypothetical protein